MHPRWILVCAAVAAAALSGLFLWAGLEKADALGSVIAAVTGIVALAVAIIGGRSAGGTGAGVEVTDTGTVTRRIDDGGGIASTGYHGPAQSGPVVVRNTGDIDQSSPGDSNTGVRFT